MNFKIQNTSVAKDIKTRMKLRSWTPFVGMCLSYACYYNSLGRYFSSVSSGALGASSGSTSAAAFGTSPVSGYSSMSLFSNSATSGTEVQTLSDLSFYCGSDKPHDTFSCAKK